MYGSYDDPEEINRIVSYCRASHEKNRLSMSTIGAFGGRGMGQTCGVADPSQWMKVFGVDIDSRDTAELIETAKQISADEIKRARNDIQPLFSIPIPDDEMAERSIRLCLAIKKIRRGDEIYQYYGGLPSEGFTMDDAVSVDRNGVAQEVWWKQGPDVGKLTGLPLHLRIRMRAAKLYAFQFVEAEKS